MKLWSWEKKPSTSKGRLKRGDIFCFAYDEQTYCFGRIIESDPKQSLIIVEILDHISDQPKIDEETILHAGRMIPPLNARDMNFECYNWRIIGHQEDYYAPDYDEIYTTGYVGGQLYKIDLHGNATSISQEEHSKYRYTTQLYTDEYVKNEIHECILQKKYSSILANKNYPTDPQEFGRFVNVLFAAGRYADVIEAILILLKDQQDLDTMAKLLTSCNNLEQYEDTLKYLEEYKNLYADKMRLWYYFAGDAYLGKKDYDNALTCIEKGFAECEREKGAGSLVGRAYDLAVLDFRNLRFRLESALEEQEKRTGNFIIDEDELEEYADDGVTTEVIIPDGIRKIGSHAFKNCDRIKSVIIPESVREISTGVFTGCTNLEKIQFPSHIDYIIKNPEVFEDTKWYKNQPKGQIIVGDYLYAYTGEEEEVVIRDTVRSIGSGVFRNKTGIKKVVIPANVKKIYAEAFCRCTNLETVEMAEGLEMISSYAFQDCEKLKEMILPSGISSIANGVYIGCKNLREVSIPTGVKQIYEELFAGATSIQKITVGDAKLTFGHDAFGHKEKYPEALYENSPELPIHLSDGDIKQYIDFNRLPENIQAYLFVKRQSKSLASYYQKSINESNAVAIGNHITELMKTKLSAKEKKNAELFFTQYGSLM